MTVGIRRTSKPPQEVDLDGKFFPWEDDGPVLLSMPGSNATYLPCFSSEELLMDVMDKIPANWDCIKQIQNGRDFFNGIVDSDRSIRIILDLRFEDGKIRFLEVEVPWNLN